MRAIGRTATGSYIVELSEAEVSTLTGSLTQTLTAQYSVTPKVGPREKRCDVCDAPFTDKSRGNSRKYCAAHRQGSLW